MSLEKVLEILIENFKPYSIFLYGSKATNSDNEKSDYEIGVIFEENNYVSRKEISKLVSDTNFSIFPFRLNEIINYDIDTPFQKNIYMNVLINGGSKHLYGEDVLHNLKAPTITINDLLADTNFNLGIALSSVRVYKSGNVELANDMFYKSCLYVTRNLIYCYTQKLCISYKEIYESSKDIDAFNSYKELLEFAYAIRTGEKVEIDPNYYYKNISYINKFVLKEIV